MDIFLLLCLSIFAARANLTGSFWPIGYGMEEEKDKVQMVQKVQPLRSVQAPFPRVCGGIPLPFALCGRYSDLPHWVFLAVTRDKSDESSAFVVDRDAEN